MITFPDTPNGRATEALYRLTLAPVDDGSHEQELAYAELCEEVVLAIIAAVLEAAR